MFLILMSLISNEAAALRMPLDPQTRAHVGVSLADLESPGVSLGMDSRLTQLIYVDVGGFISVGEVDSAAAETTDTTDDLSMRHGLFVAPGMRIPHRYGPEWNWDFTARAGFASVWSADVGDEGVHQTDPALLTGADFLVRKDSFGIRVCGRLMFYESFSKNARAEMTMVRPQGAAEVIYQW